MTYQKCSQDPSKHLVKGFSPSYMFAGVPTLLLLGFRFFVALFENRNLVTKPAIPFVIITVQKFHWSNAVQLNC